MVAGPEDWRLRPRDWAFAVALVLAVAAAAGPKLLEPQRVRNEHAAWRDVVAFYRAQHPFAERGQPYALPAELTGDEPYLGQVAAPAILPQRWRGLVPGVDHDLGPGYRAHLAMGVERGPWCLVTWPRDPGSDGERAFLITQDGLVFTRPLADPANGQALLASAYDDPGQATRGDNGAPRPPWRPAR